MSLESYLKILNPVLLLLAYIMTRREENICQLERSTKLRAPAENTSDCSIWRVYMPAGAECCQQLDS